ncbi:MAG: hypothetical protein RMY34_01290 [Aulosira sp. DedQUE10]|nr:hypothetical protein [Aulosira sp. DedQUE10]
MFGFDGDTKGFKEIMARIAANPGEGMGALTHKEVRAYARCMLPLVTFLKIKVSFEPEFKTLLAALSAGRIAHYDRSFIAAKILKLLEENDSLWRE